MNNENKNVILLPRQGFLKEKVTQYSFTRSVIEGLNSDIYFPTLDEIKYNNDRDDQNRLYNFTDLELIYYFVHQPRAVIKKDDIKDSSRKDYLRDLLQLYQNLLKNEDFFKEDVRVFSEGSLLRNLERRHIKKYEKWLAEFGNKGQPYKKASLLRKTTVMKTFFAWLYKEQVTEHPLHLEFSAIKMNSKDRPKREITTAEMLELLHHYKDHPFNHAILLLLTTTGLRIGAVARAKWSGLRYDADFRGGKYYLDATEKRGNEISRLIIGPTLESIKQYRKRGRFSTELNVRDNSPLLPNRKGEHYTENALSSYVVEIIRESGLKWLQQKEGNISAHWMRHFFAAYSYERGANIRDIQLSLGHKNYQTTERYLEQDLKQERDTALLWDEDMFDIE